MIRNCKQETKAVKDINVNADTMKVLWYDNEQNVYKAGTWNDFKNAASQNSNSEILPLEKFHNIATDVLDGIVAKLNSCPSAPSLRSARSTVDLGR